MIARAEGVRFDLERVEQTFRQQRARIKGTRVGGGKP